MKHNVWTADVPPGANLVHFVPDFSDTNVLTRTLNVGYLLVVSRAQSEAGIEYLAPYCDANKNLVVAIVQCKFVKEERVNWKEISEKMAIAVAWLEKEAMLSVMIAF